ncbi:Thiolase, C-terminal [Acididesulfobacillus acetoxydans]|uniref:acetyl-CoA C-acetyltransferase n=1 Tax=Acididesulfobacillus acetoxydans TaxID=1561005 RepID=A0A8S0VWQ8_9FIRM|nr:thiolase family protein [Acididesulfobacillus acetoxydans]CAA7601123.1 Thiolase, C-terminal [Acididesulfobacillus acetoxydans]CEJ08598.1 Thiolase, N-terminal domain protein [Acididesulfobacillus acetoxydans]
MYAKAYIPYGGYYSTPFARWQGSLQNEHAVELAASTAKKWLAGKKIDPGIFDYLVFGKTIGQLHTFYDAPWAAALMGAPNIPGCHIAQACSTSTTVVNQAAAGIETGLYETSFCLMTDRCSNGPFTVWPNPMGPGGELISESWLMDNFASDPWGGVAMIETAENVVKKAGWISKEDIDRVTFRRYEQYLDALADERAFQKRYMFPVEYKINKKKTAILEEDEGVTPTTPEGLTRLKPVMPGGVHSFGAQTHPADGNCGIIVSTRDKAQELSADKNIEIQILSYGYARAAKAHMAEAMVPAARMALQKAGIGIEDVKAVKTHNPFTANDLYLAHEMGIDVMTMNNYGCSLVYGHPQGPTTGRSIIEMVEELVTLGGGYGLFSGCAAGDTGAALVVKVS